MAVGRMGAGKGALQGEADAGWFRFQGCYVCLPTVQRGWRGVWLIRGGKGSIILYCIVYFRSRFVHRTALRQDSTHNTGYTKREAMRRPLAVPMD